VSDTQLEVEQWLHKLTPWWQERVAALQQENKELVQEWKKQLKQRSSLRLALLQALELCGTTEREKLIADIARAALMSSHNLAAGPPWAPEEAPVTNYTVERDGTMKQHHSPSYSTWTQP